MSDQNDPAALAARITELEAQLKARRGGGSPQAMAFKEPKYLIVPHGPGARSAQDALRAEFIRTAGYEPF